MGVTVQTRHLGNVRLELGTRVKWWITSSFREDEHDGTIGTLCQRGDDGPIVVRFDDLCERYAGHGELEVIA